MCNPCTSVCLRVVSVEFANWIIRPMSFHHVVSRWNLLMQHCSCKESALRWFTSTVFVWLWLMAGVDLLWENNTANWLVAGADLVWENSTAAWLAEKPSEHSLVCVIGLVGILASSDCKRYFKPVIVNGVKSVIAIHESWHGKNRNCLTII